MASNVITIRNLTSNFIKVEKYEIHDRLDRVHGAGHLSRIGKRVSSVFAPGNSSELACISSEPVSGELAPSRSCQAAIKQASLPNQILCIFFEIQKQKYQTNIIHAKCHTQYLMATDGNLDPPCRHITVYHPEHHHLVIAYRDSYKSWMRSLEDDIPLSALSIPGTHNSPTYHKALPSVRCQVVPIREQLRKGVRFLDIRVQPEHHKIPLRDEMILVHGVFPVSLSGPRYFWSVVDEVLEFLGENPSEVVIMSVKREGTGPSTDQHLSRLLRDHYVTDMTKWFTAPRIPYLGEARGKIVLIRRFGLDESLLSEWGGAGWCINADSWADNSPHSLCPSGDVCIQDFYELLDTESIIKKIQYSIEHLKRAAECVCPTDSETKLPFYINFLTASNFWKRGCWPDRIAAKLNPAIVEYLCLEHNKADEGDSVRGDGSTGIVVCDWVGYQGDWDIVRCIVGMNARFEKGWLSAIMSQVEYGKILTRPQISRQMFQALPLCQMVLVDPLVHQVGAPGAAAHQGEG
ncbi:MAG: hypothetical protein Q9163_000914 [Psora crenata]